MFQQRTFSVLCSQRASAQVTLHRKVTSAYLLICLYFLITKLPKLLLLIEHPCVSEDVFEAVYIRGMTVMLRATS
jgi:hypothetical protein